MGWFFVFALALASFAAIAWATGWRREGWPMAGAALFLGIAGYAVQGHPGLAGSSKQAAEKFAGNGAAIVSGRNAMSGRKGLPDNNWLLIADGYTRNGQFADAADVLRIAVEQQPNNGEAWLSMANALVGHAEGTLSPAALFAFRRAAQAAPDSPGPPFFLGLALAQSGRLGEARAIWADLLARSAQDAPWRADLADKLARLDALIAQQQDAATGR